MSQQTLSQLASLQSAPIVLLTPLAQYQALPVAHHQEEEPTYQSGALGVDNVVGWAASLDPSSEVIHINLRNPSRNSYLGGKAWATNLWRELRVQPLSLKFVHLTPQPATIDQLLNSTCINPVGKPKDAHVQVYPTTNLMYTPPPSLRHGVSAGCCCKGTTLPFLIPLLLAPCQPPVVGGFGHCPFPSHHAAKDAYPQHHPPHLLQYQFFAMVPWCLMRPPFISSAPPLRTEPLPDPPHGVMGNPNPALDRVGPSQLPLNFVDGNGYIVLRRLVEARDCEVGYGEGDEGVR